MTSFISRLICLLIIVTLPTHLIAQEDFDELSDYKNSVQIELGGGAYIYSLNYERLLIDGQKLSLAGQLGTSFYGSSNNYFAVFRFDFTGVIGRRLLRPEFGLGLINFNEFRNDQNYWSSLFALRIGIRYQLPIERLILRASFTPLFGTFDDVTGIMPWGGLTIGFLF